MINSICVCGAGIMGSGIAQCAAQHGFYALLFDVNEAALEKARTGIEQSLQTLADKQKITPEQQRATLSSLKFVSDINECMADVVIEAIVERTGAKVALFNQLAEVNHGETIFASNTSSLSIAEIARQVVQPERVAGMHFFNPATIMKLVEVVQAPQTHTRVTETLVQLAKDMGKTPVVCTDTPGFIVNRVARHYYLEALRIKEQHPEIPFSDLDNALEAAGFKMGPFRLMDLIGNDINYAVTESLYESFNRAERFTPSPIQQQKVQLGELGRKSGKGYYDYSK
ncbi:MAG: 3-hydroxybutyryl-CoA dehydrogenase [Dinghuibacter sp.]|nr:3-hydroxybutyryl-CoA dehydrogenase [Dinghuibacter sp.]